jgi:hypothetical protein
MDAYGSVFRLQVPGSKAEHGGSITGRGRKRWELLRGLTAHRFPNRVRSMINVPHGIPNGRGIELRGARRSAANRAELVGRK